MSRFMRRDRFVESLSLGARKCPECQTFGTLYIIERKPVLISCLHCEGEWSLKSDNYTLRRERFDNITPGYLDEIEMGS
jgi:hypothetical protein